MKQEIDTNTIKEQLDRITGNRLFNKSPRYINLITFLVEQAINGNNLKEDIIGIEVFKENYTSDKNDGLVRVYMYNLRKKLDTYYTEIGKNDPILFVLEKGSYSIKFVKNEKSNTKNEDSVVEHKPSWQVSKKTISISTVSVILICLIGYYYSTKEKVYLWESFFEKNASNVCVLADQVVLQRKAASSGEYLIRSEINSSDDFIAYIKKHDIDTLVKTGYTYFTKSIPHSIYNLSRWFFQHDSEFLRISESEFRYEEAKRNNIIYIGQHKTMSVSKEIFLRSSKKFKTEKDYFVTIEDGKEVLHRPKFSNNIQAEYAMVSFAPLNNNNNALFFVSNNDIGTMAVIDKFIDPAYIKQFYEKLPNESNYFNALFKVEGIGRTDVNCELVELEIVQ